MTTLAILVPAAFLLRPLLTGDPDPVSPDVETAGVSGELPFEIVHDTLGRGMSLAELMSANGLDPLQIHEITQVIREYKRPRSLRPGVSMRFSGPPGERPNQVSLQFNPDTLLHLTGSKEGWSARLEVVPIVTDTLKLAGVIESSLWMAHLGGDVDQLEEGGFEEVVYDLADVFAWRIDFTRDIRRGDGFKVAFERQVRPDGSVKSRRFLAIELRNRERELVAIPYPRRRGRTAYFDTEGEALRGAFLRYPVPYRITSGFTKRRYHPILKRYRPHQGIDYGAPYGTRVQATASGTVTRAGTWGSYGRVVEIRHNGGIRTRYAHLSTIASGIRPGAHVEQGQVIGRVGATGLATASHLHYEFLQNGRHRNPLTVSVPSEPALEEALMEDFRRVRDQAMALLEGVDVPEPAAGMVAVSEADEAP